MIVNKVSSHYLSQIGVLLIVILLLSPLLALIISAISDPSALNSVFPEKSAIILLAKTLFFSFSVALGGLLIAVPAASILTNIDGKKGQILRLLAVSPIAIPPYLHALSWQRFFQSIGISSDGDIVALWVEVLARLPILVAAALVGFTYLSPLVRDATKIYSDPALGFFRLTLPQLKVPLIVGVSIVLLFSINEYGLASLFIRSSYSLEIFARYSATGNSGSTLLFALPLMLLTAILVMIAITSLSRLSIPPSFEKHDTVLFSGPILFDLWRSTALFIVSLGLVIPFKEIIALALSTTAPFMTNPVIESLQYSGSISLFASILTLPLAWLLAEYLNQYPSRIIWLAVLLGFALPPSLTGVGSILFWGWTGIESIYDGWLLPILGYTTRLLPISTLFIYATIRYSDSIAWDAARVYQHGWKLWLQIRLVQVWPGMLGALLIGFSITLADLELSLLLSPAGKTSIGVRLFNYLHYGAPDQVAYLAMVVLISTVLFGIGLYLLMAHHTKGIHLFNSKGKYYD